MNLFKSSILFLQIIVLSLFSCTKKDESYLCDEDQCKHGTCNGRSCNCETGFKGRDCDEEVPPTSMKITHFLVLDFPMVDLAGNSWDDTDGADLTLMLRKGLDTVWFSDIYYENVDTVYSYKFKPEKAIEIVDPLATYNLTLLDYEGGTSFQGLTNFTFRPYLGFWDFPNSYIPYHQSAAVSIWVQYFW